MYSAVKAKKKIKKLKKKEPKKLFKANIKSINKELKEAVKERYSSKSFYYGCLDNDILEKIIRYYESKGYVVENFPELTFSDKRILIKWGS